MLGYLLDAYKLKIYNLQKRRIRDFTKKEFSLLAILIFASILGIISIFTFYKNYYVYFGSLIVLIIVAFIIFRVVTKDAVMNYENNLKEYWKKLDILKDTLENDFNLYEKEKLKKLIDLCDERLNQKDSLTKLFDPLSKVFITAILPNIFYTRKKFRTIRFKLNYYTFRDGNIFYHVCYWPILHGISNDGRISK